MKTLAARIADAIEDDVRKQRIGQHSNIGLECDEFQSEASSVSPNQTSEMISIALRFWDDWADCARHDWQYHDPMTEEQWIEFAQEIIECLRNNQLMRNEVILSIFGPQPERGFYAKIRRVLGLGI
jgi:hypothetical protein